MHFLPLTDATTLRTIYVNMALVRLFNTAQTYKGTSLQFVDGQRIGVSEDLNTIASLIPEAQNG